MSCVIGCKSVLGIVNLEILKKALEVTAKEQGIEVGSSIKDHYGNSLTSYNGMQIIGALITSNVSHGIGAAVDKEGKLHFVGDTHSCQSAFDTLKKRIELNYKKVVAILACQAMGYQVVVKEKNGITIFEGVKQ